jgi:phosphoribosylaminoimidazole carboxylase (NCAIR synthetase)
MLSIHARIDRAQRLVRMLEQDAPRLAIRVAPLTPEYQQSAKNYAAELAAQARTELEKLLEERSNWVQADSTHAAD